MKAHVLRGSKHEIAEHLIRLSGEVREAIVFEEENTLSSAAEAPETDIFADMRAYLVDVPDFDDSREAVYTRMEGE